MANHDADRATLQPLEAAEYWPAFENDPYDPADFQPDLDMDGYLAATFVAGEGEGEAAEAARYWHEGRDQAAYITQHGVPGNLGNYVDVAQLDSPERLVHGPHGLMDPAVGLLDEGEGPADDGGDDDDDDMEARANRIAMLKEKRRLRRQRYRASCKARGKKRSKGNTESTEDLPEVLPIESSSEEDWEVDPPKGADAGSGLDGQSDSSRPPVIAGSEEKRPETNEGPVTAAAPEQSIVSAGGTTQDSASDGTAAQAPVFCRRHGPRLR